MTKFKNMAKKLFAIIALLAIVVTNTKNVNAAAETITLGPASPTGKYIAGVVFSYKKTTDGRLLFCVDMHTNTAQNTTATIVRDSKLIDNGLVYILKNGYPEKSITGDNDKDYYITQTAVWWYLDEVTGSQNLGDYFKVSGSDPYNMRHYVKELVDAGLAHRNDPGSVSDAKLTIGTDDASFTLNNNYYVSGSIKATEISGVDSYSVALSGAPQGTIIEKTAGTAVSALDYNGAFNINNNESFRIKVPKASAEANELSITVIAKATGAVAYNAYEYKPADSTMQHVALLEKEQKTVKSDLTLTLATSKVTVVKIDSETKQPLAGATLVLRDSAGTELTRWTSTVNAHVIRNLAPGTYTVEEVSAPEGYQLNTNKSTFTISKEKRDIRVEFENAPTKVVVTITKIDASTKQPLAGATMAIKDSTGEIVYKFVTGTDPEVITDLPAGTYTLEEISAPEGYIRNTKVVTFTIDKEHRSHQITFENEKEVTVPDTASAASLLLLVLGIAMTGFGLEYVFKNGKKSHK